MAAAIKIDCRKAMRQLTRDFDRLKRQQVPFATAQALTAVAREVQAAETAALSETFDRPTPFTLRAFGVRAARKSDLTAMVFARDIQAAYLSPYEGGGKQVLGNKRAILTPRDLPTDVYGNIPRGKLAKLKGRPDIFVGQVKTKSGVIAGVWQRVQVGPSGKARRKRSPGGRVYDEKQGALRLLVQFTRPADVTKHLNYAERAQGVVSRRLAAEFDRALAQALATAR